MFSSAIFRVWVAISSAYFRFLPGWHLFLVMAAWVRPGRAPFSQLNSCQRCCGHKHQMMSYFLLLVICFVVCLRALHPAGCIIFIFDIYFLFFFLFLSSIFLFLLFLFFFLFFSSILLFLLLSSCCCHPDRWYPGFLQITASPLHIQKNL